MPVLLPVRSLENLGYRRFEVVVNALRGDSVEELEGQTMPRQEMLRLIFGGEIEKAGIEPRFRITDFTPPPDHQAGDPA